MTRSRSPGAPFEEGDDRAGMDQLGSGSKFRNKPNPDEAQAFPFLRELLLEAGTYSPEGKTLAIRAGSIFDLAYLRVTKQFDLLERINDLARSLPAACHECGKQLNRPIEIGGFTVTAAARAPKPRFAIVSGFCWTCSTDEHGMNDDYAAMETSTARKLRRTGVSVDLIAEPLMGRRVVHVVIGFDKIAVNNLSAPYRNQHLYRHLPYDFWGRLRELLQPHHEAGDEFAPVQLTGHAFKDPLSQAIAQVLMRAGLMVSNQTFMGDGRKGWRGHFDWLDGKRPGVAYRERLENSERRDARVRQQARLAKGKT